MKHGFASITGEDSDEISSAEEEDEDDESENNSDSENEEGDENEMEQEQISHAGNEKLDNEALTEEERKEKLRQEKVKNISFKYDFVLYFLMYFICSIQLNRLLLFLKTGNFLEFNTLIYIPRNSLEIIINTNLFLIKCFWKYFKEKKRNHHL